jgi:hypothetical protein
VTLPSGFVIDPSEFSEPCGACAAGTVTDPFAFVVVPSGFFTGDDDLQPTPSNATPNTAIAKRFIARS